MPPRYLLSPALQAMLERSLTFAPGESSLDARRAAFLALCRAFTGPCPVGVRRTDHDVQGLLVRVYQPQAMPPEGGWPTLLYLHGGGWSMGELDSHDWFAYALLERLPVAIVSVDYRLAPEHPWPAAVQDTLKAFRTLRAGLLAETLSCERLLVCGESAGGTLAAALCLALRDADERQPLGQGLLYPVMTAQETLPSVTEHANAPFLTRAAVRACVIDYLPRLSDRDVPTAMPLNTPTCSGLAPAFIGVAEFDPLRDHGIAYHGRLKAAAVASCLYVGEGLVHGCLRDDSISEVRTLYDAFAAWISQVLSLPT
ncbi:alpha/beta hydrolase [Pseudomonas silvicola]|nr:alpha/beta hydrolase [Pseudomonas silvicola]